MNRAVMGYILSPLRLALHLPGSLRRRWRYRVARAGWCKRSVELARSFGGEADPHIYRTLLQNPHAQAILHDFHWYEYMRANPDLYFANHEDARKHFVYIGYSERRLMDLDRCLALVPGYYRERYPELNLNGDAAAEVHYSYAGYYEDRFANADTEWLYNTSLHVFQFGNVGSHSIAVALEDSYKGGVLHLHWPTDFAVNYPCCSIPYEKIVTRQRDQPLRVISGAREIVSRVVSGAFQYLSTLDVHAAEPMQVDWILDHLKNSFLNDCEVIAGWFDHQFYCKLDIYAHRFNYDQGYIRICNSTVELFLYRVENLSGLEDDLAVFLDIPNFKLSRENTAKEKNYCDAYREVMTSYTVPRSTLEKLYATPYMQFFYSDQERSAFMNYWLNPRTQ
jgi:hypothetical protein